uniref:Uncharacterized protein n=1 Tax=Compsopogon caeruleus TaxID=31354 RepID=A0A7S1XG95_9RHOD|mmetsp:Transcript_6371/g.12696  ORF Transcript_6371/g.12696 Transcript_6371/m.12696 type:complete len:137 (+) Transcript_6371:165-575(+)
MAGYSPVGFVGGLAGTRGGWRGLPQSGFGGVVHRTKLMAVSRVNRCSWGGSLGETIAEGKEKGGLGFIAGILSKAFRVGLVLLPVHGLKMECEKNIQMAQPSCCRRRAYSNSTVDGVISVCYIFTDSNKTYLPLSS